MPRPAPMPPPLELDAKVARGGAGPSIRSSAGSSSSCRALEPTPTLPLHELPAAGAAPEAAPAHRSYRAVVDTAADGERYPPGPPPPLPCRPGQQQEQLPPEARLHARQLPAADAAAAAAAAAKALAAEAEGGVPACFRLRKVLVHQLLEDGTLGLLLHSTSVVGFCSPAAEAHGWILGDQIVEINSRRVAVFDEFLDQFLAAQEEGFPIEFSVLRKETAPAEAEPTDGAAAEGALDSFFSDTDFGDLAGQLQRKFGAAAMLPKEASRASNTSRSNPGADDADGDGQLPRCDSITENPYIQALRKRRSELLKSSEGWTQEESDTLATRLATQRSDALATLLSSGSGRRPTFGVVADCSGGIVGADCAADIRPVVGMAGSTPSALNAWSLTRACSRPCNAPEHSAYEIQPTPRMDAESNLDPQQFQPVSARHRWIGLGKEGQTSLKIESWR